ncbi:response regulator [Solimonas sp. K1W22B-7]|uniref:HD-GYP domain-containing protein n=1 Tax=Solimonas sp. K1W22B-7 TaxID=2303331 RepID=UPI000E32DBD3|nr:HD domain-containing phosphohydrolase [Solimonas sp. K1W22B-7]AXQ28934.1 response regulator [Solimonas sp. K1W22B-7]
MLVEPRKATLLLVDDDPSRLDALRAILQDQHSLLLATNAESALALTSEEPPPDLVLVDAAVPGMDGYELCRRLKADTRTRRIPVVLLADPEQLRDDAEFFAMAGVDCLVGPLSPALLRARVATQLTLAAQARRLAELEESRLQLIQRFGRAAELRVDPDPAGADLAGPLTRLLALAAGLDERSADTLALAALLRDVGKIGVPDSVLYKIEALSLDDWEQMRRHPLIGAQIIGQHGHPLLDTARIVALTHHEHWDGGGYPWGLAGEAIPLAGRIVAIVDAFCAIISPRSYRPARPPAQAVALILERAGSYYDPALAARLRGLLPDIEALLAH